MNIRDRQIEDTELIKYFKSQLDQIRFIGTSERLETKTKINKLSDDNPLEEQRDRLLPLWTALLGDAIVFLKQQDEREKYHDEEIYGVDDLSSYFEEIQDFEAILLGTVPAYRDHMTHAVRVFLLGEFMIRQSMGFQGVDCDDTPLRKGISPDEKEAVWAIIALCHDLGYPVEAIRLLTKESKQILESARFSIQELGYGLSPQFYTISEFTLRFIASSLMKMGGEKFAVHLQPKFFIKFANALDKYSHGVISCLILMAKLVYFMESDYTTDRIKYLNELDARQYLIRRTILRAISSHDCDEIYHLRMNNFPFLLLICDEMQEWGRPRLVDVFKRSIPTSKLTIRWLDEKKIDYEIEFSSEIPAVHDIKKEHVKAYFNKKKSKFIKVLRSAVGGKHRKLHLVFTVTDKTGPHVRSYRLCHLRPDRVEIEEPETVFPAKITRKKSRRSTTVRSK